MDNVNKPDDSQLETAPDTPKTARLYRMVMDDHVCPYGIKSKWLLEKNGFEVEDHHLKTREQTDNFKQEHSVKTTPQTFIDGERIGGYDALRARFTRFDPDSDDKTYRPVLVIFGACALMAMAVAVWASHSLISVRTLELFAAFSMSVLAVQKLRDLESFSTMFLNYDLLAKKWVPYSYLYPIAELAAGVLMIAGGAYAVFGAPIALCIGAVGAISVFKAVYMDKRELKCACVGGDTNVPLGAISLTENLVMISMGIWMLIKSAF